MEASLHSALERLGISGENGIRQAFPVRPDGLRELIRVATLTPPDLSDLEPDNPSEFESFEVEDPQGLIYGGGDLWFLSSQRTIRWCRIENKDPFRPGKVQQGDSRLLRSLLLEARLAPFTDQLPLKFNHIGDLGYARPVVYAPIRAADETQPNIILGLNRDLRVVAWAELSMTAGESACAINPWNGLLYIPGRSNSGNLEAYDISTFVERFDQPLKWGEQIEITRMMNADIQLRTPEGKNDGEGIQGVAFSANGRIYVTRSGDEPYVNRLFVYSALTGLRFGSERTWNFPGDGDEIEGIAIHPSGVLYICVNDNDAELPPFSRDNFDLYTFRFRHLAPSEV